MFYDAYIALSGFFAQGGNVLYLIALTTFLMWTLLFERLWYFRSEHRGVVHGVTDQWESRVERRSWSAHVIREALISQTRERISGSYPIILTCVALCPLLGLLGTVTGMIAVFERHGHPRRQCPFNGGWSFPGDDPDDVGHDRRAVRNLRNDLPAKEDCLRDGAHSGSIDDGSLSRDGEVRWRVNQAEVRQS